MISKTLFIISAIPIKEKQGASYARIMAYARALTKKENITVYLLSTKYPHNLDITKKMTDPNIFSCGESRYHVHQTSFIKRTLSKVFGMKEFNVFLENVSQLTDTIEGKKSTLIYPSINNYSNELKLLKMLKSKHIPTFSERNELNIGKMMNYPFPKNYIKKFLFALYFPFKYLDHSRQDSLVAKYDGNIVISKNMEKRVSKFNKNLLRIPILVDTGQFKGLIQEKKSSDRINIGYTGYLTQKKDGIGELIKSIAVLKGEYKIENVVVNLYGSGYRDTVAKLKKLIKHLRLEKNIIIHGNIKSNEIPSVLNEQDILILARPSNLQTQYGFSTKLAEYMAIGKIVLTTDVSDNTLYINDSVNGFISESYLADQLAAKLSEIILKKKYLDASIKQNAITTAVRHFDSSNYSNQLNIFLFPEN